jgi:hypothetical protein
MVLKICTRFSLHSRFYRYSYRDEFVADAVARCLSHSLDRIDLSHPKCNPFSYLTQTAFNVFRQKIKNEKKFRLAIQNLRDQIFDDLECEFRLKSSSSHNSISTMNDSEYEDENENSDSFN